MYDLLTAKGPDAESFLQAQLTQDLTRLDGASALPAAWCNAKGRVIATMRLIRLPESIGMIIGGGLANEVLARISIYRFRAKLELELVPGWRGVATHDRADIDRLNSIGLLPAITRHALVQRNGLTAIRLGDEQESIELFGNEKDTQKAGLTQTLSSSEWLSAAIHAGQLIINKLTSEKYTPHMLNLDKTGAVSFSKGCYPGQEIVARTEHLGKSNRRLVRLVLDADASAVGDDVIFEAQTVGSIVCASGSDALAVVPEALLQTTLTVNGKDAKPASLLA